MAQSFNDSVMTETAAQYRRFSSCLISWQKKHGRHHLPWQTTQNPYHVWLSEIMLQQTQVSTVIEYYQKFLKKFPTIELLAQAPADEVLALWSGLGYYSRARNLHQCAKTIVSQYHGLFPQEFEFLLALPGIGPSTAAAISAFCFGKRISILDGNVRRVLTRLLGFEKDLSKTSAQNELWVLAQQLLPSENVLRKQPDAMRSYTQGLMDLGSQICLPRKTDCENCPVQKLCVASKEGSPLAYPVKTKKLKRTTRTGYLLWLTSPLGVWLVPRASHGVWGGLYSMPLFEIEAERTQLIQALKVKEINDLPTFKHVLTHFDWLLQATLVKLTLAQAKKLTQCSSLRQGSWYTPQEWAKLGLPAPIKKLLLQK